MVTELNWIKGFCCDHFYKQYHLFFFLIFPFFPSSQLSLLLHFPGKNWFYYLKEKCEKKTVTHGRTSGWLPMSLLIDTHSRSCRSWLTWPPALMASAFLSNKSKRRGRSWRPTNTVQSLSRSNWAKVFRIHWRSWGVHTWERQNNVNATHLHCCRTAVLAWNQNIQYPDFISEFIL